MSGLRRTVERRSGPALVLLSGAPRAVVPLLSAALLLLGLFLPRPAGPLFLAALVLFVGWLSYLSWPVLTVQARAVRLGVLLVLVLVAVAH